MEGLILSLLKSDDNVKGKFLQGLSNTPNFVSRLNMVTQFTCWLKPIYVEGQSTQSNNGFTYCVTIPAFTPVEGYNALEEEELEKIRDALALSTHSTHSISAAVGPVRGSKKQAKEEAARILMERIVDVFYTRLTELTIKTLELAGEVNHDPQLVRKDLMEIGMKLSQESGRSYANGINSGRFLFKENKYGRLGYNAVKMTESDPYAKKIRVVNEMMPKDFRQHELSLGQDVEYMICQQFTCNNLFRTVKEELKPEAAVDGWKDVDSFSHPIRAQERGKMYVRQLVCDTCKYLIHEGQVTASTYIYGSTQQDISRSVVPSKDLLTGIPPRPHCPAFDASGVTVLDRKVRLSDLPDFAVQREFDVHERIMREVAEFYDDITLSAAMRSQSIANQEKARKLRVTATGGYDPENPQLFHSVNIPARTPPTPMETVPEDGSYSVVKGSASARGLILKRRKPSDGLTALTAKSSLGLLIVCAMIAPVPVKADIEFYDFSDASHVAAVVPDVVNLEPKPYTYAPPSIEMLERIAFAKGMINDDTLISAERQLPLADRAMYRESIRVMKHATCDEWCPSVVTGYRNLSDYNNRKTQVSLSRRKRLVLDHTYNECQSGLNQCQVTLAEHTQAMQVCLGRIEEAEAHRIVVRHQGMSEYLPQSFVDPCSSNSWMIGCIVSIVLNAFLIVVIAYCKYSSKDDILELNDRKLAERVKEISSEN